MLTRLHIQDLALIDSLDIEFGEGLCLLTGETGAGKSILVEALGLLAGARAETEIIRTGADQALLEAEFAPGPATEAIASLLKTWDLPFDSEVVLRRRIQRNGRSTATVNGAAVSLGQLKELGSLLVAIHGQHLHRSLLDEESHREILDALPAVATRAEAVLASFQRLSQSLARLRALQRTAAERDQRFDTIRFQLGEIERVTPKPGEDEDLLIQKNRLQNAERIATDASFVADLLQDGETSASSRIAEALHAIARLSECDPSWTPFDRDLRDASAILGSIASEAERTAATTVFDAKALESILQRLSDLDRLKRKYGPSLDDVMRHQAALREELDHLSGESADPAAAAQRVEEDFAAYVAAGRRLSVARGEAARSLERRVEEEVRPLALEKARFQVELPPVPCAEPGHARPEGLEDVRFLFSANPGEPLKPLAKIASGGELSRIMLALLTAATSGQGPHTLIFDEVDAGIGGKPAERVGRRLRDLAVRHQVLCITHLPQIAAFARRHILVSKAMGRDQTRIHARALTPSERPGELARMLAGETVAGTALRHAEELLRVAREG